MVARTSPGPITNLKQFSGEQHYEESLLVSTQQGGLFGDVEEGGAEESLALRQSDLCVIKNMINMGRKDGTVS